MPDKKIGTPAVASASQCSPKLPVPTPWTVEAVAGRAYWTPSPARKTWTSWPSSAAVRATSSASAPRVGFSGPVARWIRSFAMRLIIPAQAGVHAAQVGLARLELLEQVDQLLALLAINS